CKAQLAGQAAGFRAFIPDRATRARRNSQMMTPVHWDHCWHYFCRKLKARSVAAPRPSSADRWMRAMAAEQTHGQGGYIGKALRRREDVRFVQGRGRYVDDIVLPGAAWCAFVRSPHAHARIRSLSTKAAALRPGVLLTLTAEDWAKAGHGELTV